MNHHALKCLFLTLFFFSLAPSALCQERFLDKVPEWYPDLTDTPSQKLVAGYLCSLDFYMVMVDPQRALRERREWNHDGYKYTKFLIGQWSRKDQRYRTALLLGGTHDDRAAVALLKFLKTEPELDVRLAIYSALAELGYYTDYYARLLLAEHERRSSQSPKYQKGRGWPETTMRLLSIIHHPEAVWAQDQLEVRGLTDGAVAEEEGPLIEFRDIALGRRPMPNRVKRVP